MKNIVENNVNDLVKKYKYSALLTLIIFILFLLFGYSNNNVNYDVYLNNVKVQLTYRIYTKDNEQYINIDDLTQVFGDYIYNDKISGKLIITTYNNLKKVKTDDQAYVIKVDNNRYCNLKLFMTEIGYDVVTSKDKVYILNNEYIEGRITNNRTEVYDNETNEVICFLSKGNEVNISVNHNLKYTSKKVVNLKVIQEDKIYYGYSLKNNVQYEYNINDAKTNNAKFVLVKADTKLETSTDYTKVDIVAINMYRLSGVNTLTRLDYTNNVQEGIKVLATINNGQSSSNYDSDILTMMLNSESNRDDIIMQIAKSVEKLAGVNLDFGNFKTSDKANYTQFVKELAAVLHAKDKILVVSVPSQQYIDVEAIVKYADYIVLQQYSVRTLASKTSGPISSISYMDNLLKDILNKNIDIGKVILEIPAYTILWTERRGTVINAELYNMKTMQSYLTENNIQSKLDTASGQNYINYTKGITTYKMWLEDEYSISEKTKLANKYDLAGVSIYRSGMELKTIYDNISKILNK